MARKSKYVKESGQEVNVLSVTFHVGLYLRLSVVDGDDVEYNSIGNQEKICVNFLKGKADSQVVQVYTDNGFTGMNYKRPGFQEMFADLQSGKINGVIVKDISRLGRNYILTSDLIERTLPEMGVRLICVNDTFDSFDPEADRESILMPFKLIMNDSYVKNTSRKITSSICAKMDSGEFLPSKSSIPCGYRRMPEENTFAVDEGVSQVIVRIFERRADGESFNSIARILNEDGIPCPGKLRLLRGDTKAEKYVDAVWIRGTIRKITSDPVYLGHRIHGKVKKDRLGADKKWRSPEEWQIIKDAHPAIVPQKLFDAVQEVNKAELERRASFHKREAPTNDYRDIFRGKIYCADCLKAMGNVKQIQRAGSRAPNHYNFECNTYTNSGHMKCFRHYISHEIVMEKLQHCLNKHLEAAVDVEQLLDDIKRRPDVSRNQVRLEDELTSARVRRMNMEAKKERLFYDFVEGILSKSEYEQLKKKYDLEYAGLCTQEEKAREQVTALDKLVNNTHKWVAAVRKSVEFPVIDAQLVNELVEKIYVKSDRSIHIALNYGNPYEAIAAYLEQVPEVMDDAG